jgi:uncharacterized protein (DUF427 family)
MHRPTGVGEAVLPDVLLSPRGARRGGARRHAVVHPPRPGAQQPRRPALGAFDHWFEEDEEVFVHARDPYKRIEILRSTRHVVVEVDGVVVADSHRPTMLFESTSPSRHYLPIIDVRMDLIEPSSTRTQCPYKGEAHYWNVRLGDTIHRDLVWSYATPVRESAPIAGLLCFYDEKLDITIDGTRQTRPTSPFS